MSWATGPREEIAFRIRLEVVTVVVYSQIIPVSFHVWSDTLIYIRASQGHVQRIRIHFNELVQISVAEFKEKVVHQLQHPKFGVLEYEESENNGFFMFHLALDRRDLVDIRGDLIAGAE